MAGVDKFALCKLMGQSSPTVTEKYYIHVTTEHVAAGFLRARQDGGPTLIECKTYRYVGHHEGDPGTDYRTREEVQQWKQQDPVKLARKRLLDLGVGERELQAADQEVERLIDEAVEFAEKSP